jgi:hypothetical protein
MGCGHNPIRAGKHLGFWVMGLGFWQKPKTIFKLEEWVFYFSTTCGTVDTSNRSSDFSYLTDLSI